MCPSPKKCFLAILLLSNKICTNTYYTIFKIVILRGRDLFGRASVHKTRNLGSSPASGKNFTVYNLTPTPIHTCTHTQQHNTHNSKWAHFPRTKKIIRGFFWKTCGRPRTIFFLSKSFKSILRNFENTKKYLE